MSELLTCEGLTKHYGAKTAGRQQKQAQQKIVKGHAHGSSSFHSMDMVPLRGSRDGTQRRERANLMAAGRLQ